MHARLVGQQVLDQHRTNVKLAIKINDNGPTSCDKVGPTKLPKNAKVGFEIHVQMVERVHDASKHHSPGLPYITIYIYISQSDLNSISNHKDIAHNPHINLNTFPSEIHILLNLKVVIA